LNFFKILVWLWGEGRLKERALIKKILTDNRKIKKVLKKVLSDIGFISGMFKHHVLICNSIFVLNFY